LSKDWIIAGKVVSGAGEGAYFTQINWVQEQCHERLGRGPLTWKYLGNTSRLLNR